jgi:CRP/FNR family transcriptional regulator
LPLRSILPVTNVTEYGEGQVIYDGDNPSKSIYLLITGMVEISQTIEGDSGLLLEIVGAEEMLGESAFLSGPHRCARATAIEKTRLMSWTISEIEELVMKRPELAVALLRHFAERNAEIGRRIKSLSVDTVERRLARSLIRLSERMGTPEGDGSVRMIALTNEMLSRYVGAARETVTQYMDQFRERGYVTNSRRGIVLRHAPFRTLLSDAVRRQSSRRRQMASGRKRQMP